MEEPILRRLAELKDELSKGQEQLELLDRKRQEVRDTLLRISGAIQVLEELKTRNGRETEVTVSPALAPEAIAATAS